MKSMKANWKEMVAKLISMPVQAKASLAFLVVNFMQKGMSFITAPIFTRLLTTEEYGKITVYLSWVDVIGIFAMFGLSYNVFYNGILEYRQDKDRFTLSMLTLSNIITIGVFIIVWTINQKGVRFLDVSDELIYFMFVSFLFEPAFEFWKTRQRFEFKYKLVCIFMILIMICAPVLSLAGIFLFPSKKIFARIVGAQLITLTLSFGCYIAEIIKAKGKVGLKYWRYAICYNLPLIPYFLSGYILTSSDRLMISYYCGDDKAGIYGIAYTMSAVVSIIWNSVNSTMIPTIYKRCEEKRMHTLSEFVMPVVMIYAAVCTVIMLLAPEVISILAPSSYGEGMYVIPSVVGGVFFMSLFTIFSNIIYFYKKPKYVMWAGTLAAVGNIILNMIFIPKVGYLAAGYTTLVAYMFEVIFALIFMVRITGRFIYDMKRLAVYSMIVLASSIFAPCLYHYFIIRIILFVALCAFLWEKRYSVVDILWRRDKNGE